MLPPRNFINISVPNNLDMLFTSMLLAVQFFCFFLVLFMHIYSFSTITVLLRILIINAFNKTKCFILVTYNKSYNKDCIYKFFFRNIFIFMILLQEGERNDKNIIN